MKTKKAILKDIINSNKPKTSIPQLNGNLELIKEEIERVSAQLNEELKWTEREIERQKSGELRTYETRPEFNSDLDEFIKLADDKISDIEFVAVPIDNECRALFPGREQPDSNAPLFYSSVKFKSTLSYYELLEIMGNILDGHILRQTLAFEEDYTGDRDFDIE